MCSWINNNCDIKSKLPTVPTLLNIQETLVNIGDKPSSFIKSREWIGSFEICLFLDHCYNVSTWIFYIFSILITSSSIYHFIYFVIILQVSSKIIHIRTGKEIGLEFAKFVEHFQKFGSPVMIGKNY